MNCIAYTTARLQITPISQPADERLLTRILTVLTEQVVEHLPPYFQHITQLTHAANWLTKMHSESQLLGIYKLSDIDLASQEQLIGFVFLSRTEQKQAHLGYLLAQEHWAKGYAKECLQGLIDFNHTHKHITHLHAGVDADNLASIKLLRTLGFTGNETAQGTQWYCYDFSV